MSSITADKKHLQVSELFYSIQGESSWAGYPCAFIRLTDCNLRCTYCDSSYTWKEKGHHFSYNRILEWLGHYPGVIVELTGGEPLLQENIYPFIDLLLNDGRTVLIETNGSLGIEKIPSQVSVILDIKCPDSGMADQMEWNNISRLADRRKKNCRDDIKFVVSSEHDFLWAKNIIIEYRLEEVATLLISPVDYLLAPSHLAELLMQHMLPAKMQLQLHKLLWPEKERGV